MSLLRGFLCFGRSIRSAVSERRLTVIQLLPALNSGGVERATLETGQALVDRGHKSIVISAGGRLVEQLTNAGSEHITLDVATKSLFTLKKIWTLKRLFQKIRPDIVHARSRLPAWLTYLALQGMKKPRPHFVTSVHGLNSPGFYSAILTRGERVVCVSSTVRDYVLQHYGFPLESRVIVIAPGINSREFPSEFQPDSKWKKDFFSVFPQLENNFLLTLPGRGTRLKGHRDAIELLAALKENNIHAQLLLLGAREPHREAYIQEIEQFAVQKNVADRLVITPPRHDVREIYAISSLILQLSTKPEAFGRTVLEALSLGRPVLGYAHGGVDELLRQLYPVGRVPVRDFAALVNCASRLLHNAPSVNSFRDYSLESSQARLLKVYHALAG